MHRRGAHPPGGPHRFGQRLACEVPAALFRVRARDRANVCRGGRSNTRSTTSGGWSPSRPGRQRVASARDACGTETANRVEGSAIKEMVVGRLFPRRSPVAREPLASIQGGPELDDVVVAAVNHWTFAPLKGGSRQLLVQLCRAGRRHRAVWPTRRMCRVAPSPRTLTGSGHIRSHAAHRTALPGLQRG